MDSTTAHDFRFLRYAEDGPVARTRLRGAADGPDLVSQTATQLQ